VKSEVQFPVDEEALAGLLVTGYIRRNGDGTVEFGIAKNDGTDYAWSLVSDDQFIGAFRLLFPEIKTNG